MKKYAKKWMPILVGFISLSGCVTAQTKTQTAHYAETRHSVILNQLLAAKGFTNKVMQMMIVDFPPLSRSPSHRHPCPTFGYVISGEIVSVFEGKTYHYKAGDSFYETPNGLHNDARNDSKTTTAKLLVIYVKDTDKPSFEPIVH